MSVTENLTGHREGGEEGCRPKTGGMTVGCRSPEGGGVRGVPTTGTVSRRTRTRPPGGSPEVGKES